MRSSLESLQDIAMRQVIANFATHPFSPNNQSCGLSKETSAAVCLGLPLPTEVGACYFNSLIHYVDNENYWKRASGSVSAANNHKQLYLENNLKMFGNVEETSTAVVDLGNVMHGLYLTSPTEELDYYAELHNLAAICLSKSSHVKAQLSDMLTKTRQQPLVSLAITESNLLDQDLHQIVTGLGENSTLLHLDVSNNAITCGDGFKELVTSMLMTEENAQLTYLDLSGNRLDQNAGNILGKALRINNTLLTLSLRLNRLKDCGGWALLACLRENCSLQLINVSANGLGSRVVGELSVLEQSKTSRSFTPTIVLTSNPFLSQDMEILRSFRSFKIDTRSQTKEGVAKSKQIASTVAAYEYLFYTSTLNYIKLASSIFNKTMYVSCVNQASSWTVVQSR